MSDHRTAGLQPLSDALWAERHELECLLARMVALRLVLQAGEHRFVAACLDQVLASMGALAEHTRGREQALREVEAAAVTLETLAATAPPPLAWALAEHDTSLAGLLADLDAELAATRRLARAAREQTLGALSVARGQSPEQAAEELGQALELDLRAQACRGVLATLRNLVPPGLRSLVTQQD